jgi:acyl-CoA hydrolase
MARLTILRGTAVRWTTASEAVAAIRPGQRVFVHGAAATPNVLLDALVGRVDDGDVLHDVELIHLHTMGPARYADARYAGNFRVANLFVGENVRARVDGDHVDYLPCFLSEIPSLFRSRRRPLDVALVHVSPPDRHGFCSLGVSVDVARAAVDCAPLVVAQVNERMPRVFGDGVIHVSRFHACVAVDVPLPEAPRRPASTEELAVGRHVATLVEDGATLQLGIGSIPDAVCRALTGHRHLGLHTEMWSDGALDLLERGVIDNSRKRIHTGRTVSGFVVGSQRLYDHVGDNASVEQLDIAYVNAPNVIARNDAVCAINSAVEVDLGGQVCADSVGPRIISGVGGQMDFLRGAALSARGRPILALTSRTRDGRPRIVPQLAPGAGVVTTRAHLHYVVTEHGVADLFGRTLRERAAALVALAHPDDREALGRAWHALAAGGRRAAG